MIVDLVIVLLIGGAFLGAVGLAIRAMLDLMADAERRMNDRDRKL